MPKSGNVKGELRAGAAKVDITPKLGTQIGGDIGRRRPAEVVLDPIYARALVLEGGGTKLCLLSLDILGITDEWVAEVRRQAAESFGFDPQAVMVHTVQNHAAPSLGHHMVSKYCTMIPPEMEWLRGGDPEYDPFAVERIMEAIRLADGALEPASIGVARGIEDRVAFNRRFVMRDGSGKTHPGAAMRNDILYREGPMDPEVGVVCVTGEQLRNIAMILHHTCHPVHGYPKHYISAGWPGAWAREVAAAYGPDCVPLVFNGCCGNIHHANHLDPRQIDTPERMGRCLAETTRDALERLSCVQEPVLAHGTAHIPIPHRRVPAEELQQARDLLAEHPEPIWKDEEQTAIDWSWCYALSLLDLEDLIQHEPTYDYEIQAFRIGDIALVAVPGEPFVEAQLRIKLASPAAFTFMGHMSNGYVGYLPTIEAFRHGGYETNTAYWSSLVPEALDMVVDAAGELLGEMFAD